MLGCQQFNAMSWATFHCDDPDFTVRSIPDDVRIQVRRESLRSSEVFRDMFSCCDTGPSATAPNGDNDVLDLDENAEVLTVLLRLLHFPLPPPVPYPCDVDREEKFITQIRTKKYEPGSIIPLPLLPLLFSLVDKYILSESIIQSLEVHVLAHAPVFPLQVYGFATLHGMPTVASKASQYLGPLASYTTQDVKVIPTVEAYHKLVRLQDLRVRALRTLLLGEEIFPHGYGSCPSHHQATSLLWNTTRNNMASWINTDTDVAGEMSTISGALPSCKICDKAWTAAVEMLAYKCRKVPKRIDQLPKN